MNWLDLINERPLGWLEETIDIPIVNALDIPQCNTKPAKYRG